MGLIPFLLLIAGALVYARQGYRNGNLSVNERTPRAINYAGIIALLVRDGTYSSTALDPGTILGGGVWAGNRAYANAAGALHDNSFRAALDSIGLAQTRSPEQAAYFAAEGLIRERSVEQLLDINLSQSWQALRKVDASAQEELRRAAGAYEKAVHLASGDAAYHHNLGWLYAALGEDRRAENELSTAVRLEPSEAAYLVSIGLFRERNGDLQASMRAYAEAVASAPRLIDSDFFEDLNQRHPTAAIIDEAASLLSEPPHTPVNSAALARLHIAQGDTRQARQELEAALRTLPTLSYAWVNLGDIREREGAHGDAELSYRRALLADRANVLAQIRLARLSGRADVSEATSGDTDVSEHALRTARLYQTYPPAPNDLVPVRLLDYCRRRMRGVDPKEVSEARQSAL